MIRESAQKRRFLQSFTPSQAEACKKTASFVASIMSQFQESWEDDVSIDLQEFEIDPNFKAAIWNPSISTKPTQKPRQLQFNNHLLIHQQWIQKQAISYPSTMQEKHQYYQSVIIEKVQRYKLESVIVGILNSQNARMSTINHIIIGSSNSLLVWQALLECRLKTQQINNNNGPLKSVLRLLKEFYSRQNLRGVSWTSKDEKVELLKKLFTPRTSGITCQDLLNTAINLSNSKEKCLSPPLFPILSDEEHMARIHKDIKTIFKTIEDIDKEKTQ